MTNLNLHSNRKIKDIDIYRLYNLEKMILTDNKKISAMGITLLRKMRKIYIKDSILQELTRAQIQKFTADLEYLKIYNI